jgi:hypothetical protein
VAAAGTSIEQSGMTISASRSDDSSPFLDRSGPGRR